jgi:hypothetical protein
MKATETSNRIIEVADKAFINSEAFEEERRSISEAYPKRDLNKADEEHIPLWEADNQDRERWFTGLTKMAVGETMSRRGHVVDGMTLQEIVEAMAMDENDIPKSRRKWVSYDFEFGPDGQVVEIIKHVHLPGRTERGMERLRGDLKRIPHGHQGSVLVHATIPASRRAR